MENNSTKSSGSVGELIEEIEAFPDCKENWLQDRYDKKLDRWMPVTTLSHARANEKISSGAFAVAARRYQRVSSPETGGDDMGLNVAMAGKRRLLLNAGVGCYF